MDNAFRVDRSAPPPRATEPPPLFAEPETHRPPEDIEAERLGAELADAFVTTWRKQHGDAPLPSVLQYPNVLGTPLASVMSVYLASVYAAEGAGLSAVAVPYGVEAFFGRLAGVAT